MGQTKRVVVVVVVTFSWPRKSPKQIKTSYNAEEVELWESERFDQRQR